MKNSIFVGIVVIVIIIVALAYLYTPSVSNEYEVGSVEINFESGSDNLGNPVRIYNNEGDLVNEKQIMDINQVIIVDNLVPGKYVAKVENIGPPGTNEKEFVISAGQITKLTLFVKYYV